MLSISTFFLLSDNKLLTHHIYADDLIFTCLTAILRCRKNTTKRVDEEEVRLSNDDHLIVDACGGLEC